MEMCSQSGQPGQSREPEAKSLASPFGFDRARSHDAWLQLCGAVRKVRSERPGLTMHVAESSEIGEHFFVGKPVAVPQPT